MLKLNGVQHLLGKKEATKWGQVPGAPEVQEYGEPVRARLQHRLEDPQWQLAHAARTDKRKAIGQKATEDEQNPVKVLRFNPVVPIAGLPVPAASSLGSADLMESHFKTFSPAHKIAVNFNPGNHTMMICGRPVQLIMLSHEGAGWLERDMYLPWLFRPLPAIVIDGYTAEHKDSPRGPKHFCVIRWFQVIFLKS